MTLERPVFPRTSHPLGCRIRHEPEAPFDFCHGSGLQPIGLVRESLQIAIVEQRDAAVSR
jgi:hypothetical protein